MTPLVKVERSVATSMEQRLALMQQPAEFFARYMNGRTPTLRQKMIYVEEMLQRLTAVHLYENDCYYVEVRYKPPFAHLDIRRHDLGNCKNWSEIQQIKNQIVGPEHEAVELFPSESRLVDTANQYHIWVHLDPNFRFPFGMWPTASTGIAEVRPAGSTSDLVGATVPVRQAA